MQKQLFYTLRGIFFSVVVFFSLFVIAKDIQPSPISVSKTAEDTSPFYISPSSNYCLIGEMSMYPGVFLMPSSIDESGISPVTITDLSQIRDEACISEDTYTATIRFFLKTAAGEYAFVLPDTFCEYLVFINGDTVAVSQTLHAANPPYATTRTIIFPEANEEIYEVVIVAITPLNSTAPSSSTILFGEKNHIERYTQISFAAVTIIIAIIIVTIIFTLIQYLAVRREKLLTSFILLSSAVFFRIVFTGNIRIIMLFFPHLPYQFGTVMTGLTMPLLLLALIYHSFCLFPSLFPRKAMVVVCSLQIVPLLNFLTLRQFAFMNIAANITYASAYALCFYIVLKAHKRKYTNSVLFSLGLVVFTICGCLEAATVSLPVAIHFPQFYPFVVFSITEVIILAKKYSDQETAEQYYTDELTKTLETMQASENAFLNAQMKPHFLYNTLNTIADLCVSDPDKAKMLINALEDYLKLILSIDNMEKTVPLSQEMELVSSYTKIEKERFPAINFYTDFPIRMPKVNMPPLTLQPLIENAIKHGVRKSDKPGAITLRIRDSYDSVTFYVSDNGVGMDESTMKKLFEQPKENKSIGVYNIDKRLNNIYHTHLEVDSTIGLGTCVSFTIPK